MKSAIKVLAIMMIALSFSAGFDGAADAQSKGNLRGLIRDAIKEQIVALEDRIGDINDDLAVGLPRANEMKLVRERRQLNSLIRQLDNRRQRARGWNSFQLAFFAKIFLPKDVSPS